MSLGFSGRNNEDFAMASDFASAESEKLITMFNDECRPLRLNLTIERAECEKKMTDEINPLDAGMMREVGLKFERRVPDSTAIEILLDSQARVIGFSFKNAENWERPLVARHKSY